MPATNVSMTFQNTDGSPVSNGYIVASLSEDAATNDSKQIVAGIKVRGQLDNVGTTTDFRLWPSDQLTPSDSFYYLSVYNSSGTLVWSGTYMSRTAAITYTIDGVGSVPSTGAKGQLSIPVSCTITGWVITADQSGSAVVDILRSTYSGFPTTSSIAGTNKPTLSSAQKNENLTIPSWGSTAINAGDVIQFSLSSVTSCTRLNIAINITIP